MNGLSIEGFAIVSSDGMLAGADGLMPNSLKFKEDLDFLDRSLDAATLLIHGRKSNEAQDNSANRRRLLLSRSAGAFSGVAVEPNVWLWNPDATPFEAALGALGIASGVIAILGGTAAYDLFLPRYAKFHLSRADKVSLPGGVPVFAGVDAGRPPEAVLEANGLHRSAEIALDAQAALRHQTYLRAA